MKKSIILLIVSCVLLFIPSVVILLFSILELSEYILLTFVIAIPFYLFGFAGVKVALKDIIKNKE